MSRYLRCSAMIAALSLFCLIRESVADQGDDSPFFQQLSQLPFNSVQGMPAVAPRLVQSREWQISVEQSNQFAGGLSGDERLVLDGESTRLAVRHRQRLGRCWQLEATLPFVSHHEGKFDRAIDEWHKFFGLPDANRDSTEFGRLLYYYSDSQGVRHKIKSPQSGIGDVQLAVQRALGCSSTADSSGAEHMIRAGLKLPTGNPTEIRGSGELDFFADWQSPIWTSHERWRWGMAAGLLVPTRTDRFARQESLAAYGSIGAQFVFTQRLRLIAQLDGHSAYYRSALRELGDASFNVVFGARFLAARAYTFELSISEDAAIDTTPDIVARLAITYRPER